jgi:hypothetical protein
VEPARADSCAGTARSLRSAARAGRLSAARGRTRRRDCRSAPRLGCRALFGSPPVLCTEERDAESGFDYFGARYYASRLGRFTTVDPALNIEAALADPQRWNR